LNKEEIDFEEFKVDIDITRESVLEQFPNARMLPVIVVDGDWIPDKQALIKLCESVRS
jgi:hypothetical protein